MAAPLTPAALPSLVRLWGQLDALSSDSGRDARELLGLSGATFRAIMFEELLGRSGNVRKAATVPAAEGLPQDASPGPEALEPAAPSPEPSGAGAEAPASAAAVPPDAAALIAQEAARTGVDPALLAAIRKAENGGPGREFGIRSVPAPTLEGQARVAANTVRNTLRRYAEQGGQALDPATGRYTEGFLRYLSARYAPVGAANDPLGLNRSHAANLIALYRRVSREGSQG
jgi:hypothetical protein